MTSRNWLSRFRAQLLFSRPVHRRRRSATWSRALRDSQQLECRVLLAGTIERVSVANDGTQWNYYSDSAAISGNGRYVAFRSVFSGDGQIFVHDRQDGTTKLVSEAGGGQRGNSWSYGPSISADGRYVTFVSTATNLVGNYDHNHHQDVFVRDLQTGATALVSVDRSGSQLYSDSDSAVISANGRYIIFTTADSGVVSGDTNGNSDVFVRDLKTGVNTRVSVASDSTQGNSGSSSGSISADGRYVTFISSATNLVSGDTNGAVDLFVRDLKSGITTRVSVASDGTQGNSGSGSSTISADGRYVAFTSSASNLVSGDTNGNSDVFVRDLLTGTTTRISVDSNGAQGNSGSDSGPGAISADGRYVAFTSSASNLVSNDSNGKSDLFVRDLQAAITARVSITNSGAQAEESSYGISINANGQYVAFFSDASNYVSGDTNGQRDVFVRELFSLQNLNLSSSSIGENKPVGTVVGVFSVHSASTYTYELAAGAGDTDNGSFTIVGDQLKTNAIFNHLGQTSYSIRVRVIDNSGATLIKLFTLTVNNPPARLNISKGSIPENRPVGTVVGEFSAIDPDANNMFSYQLASGDRDSGNGSFTIVGNQLRTNTAFNYAAQHTYSIRVRVTDNLGSTLIRVFRITVTTGSVPTNLSLSQTKVPANKPVGTVVGTFSASDSDAGEVLTYRLASGDGSADNGSFKIVGNQLRTNAVFDSNVKYQYSIRVRVTDHTGATLIKTFTITVNRPPTSVVLSNASIPEHRSAGFGVGDFSAIDPDGDKAFTYSLVSGTGGADNGSFAIRGSKLVATAVFDYRANSSYSIRVQVTDADGATMVKVFTITVLANRAPVNLWLTVTAFKELVPVGSYVGHFDAFDFDAGELFSYSLVAGAGSADNGSFTIDGGGLKSNAILRYAGKSRYSIRVRVTDLSGATYEKTFTLTLGKDDHGDTPANATLINVPFHTSGSIESQGDNDYFKFIGVAGQKYVFQATSVEDFEVALFLYGADGSNLAFDFSNPPRDPVAQIDWTAPANGTYFLGFRTFFARDVGTYTLDVKERSSGRTVGCGAGREGMHWCSAMAPSTTGPWAAGGAKTLRVQGRSSGCGRRNGWRPRPR